jgi:hypothetical protein
MIDYNFGKNCPYCKQIIVMDLDQEQKAKLQDRISKYEDISDAMQTIVEKTEGITAGYAAIMDNMNVIAAPVAQIAVNTAKGFVNIVDVASREIVTGFTDILVDVVSGRNVPEETKARFEESKCELKILVAKRKENKKQQRIQKRNERRNMDYSASDKDLENEFYKYMK